MGYKIFSVTKTEKANSEFDDVGLMCRFSAGLAWHIPFVFTARFESYKTSAC